MTTRTSLAIGLVASVMTLGVVSLPAVAADPTGCPAGGAGCPMAAGQTAGHGHMGHDQSKDDSHRPDHMYGDPTQTGPISKQDFLAMHATRFDQADANKDGTLTREEMMAAHQSMSKMMEDCPANREGKKGHRNRDMNAPQKAPAPQGLPQRNEP